MVRINGRPATDLGEAAIMSTKKALVLTGDGINCERESAWACKAAGFNSKIIHINDLIRDRLTLDQLQSEYSLLYLPGGFSFGDELGSGRILALKLRTALGWNLGQYAKRGGLVLGVCNGFQALIRMDVFGKDISITHNVSGRFLNRWIKLIPNARKYFSATGFPRDSE